MQTSQSRAGRPVLPGPGGQDGETTASQVHIANEEQQQGGAKIFTAQFESLDVNTSPQDGKLLGSAPPPVPLNPDWSGMYKDLPPTLKIAPYFTSTGQSRGRGLFTTQDIKIGPIFNAKPIVNVIEETWLNDRCNSCFLSGLDLDWQEKVDESPIKMLLLSSFEVSLVSCGSRRFPVADWQEVEAMHVSDIKSLNEEHKTTFSNLASRLMQFVGSQTLHEMFSDPKRELVKLASKWFTNSQPTLSIAGDFIGTFQSPVVALINHSCEPNAVLVFPFTPTGDGKFSNSVQVRAIREIKAGDEVTISYADTGMPTWARRQHLKHQYDLDCDCPLCVNPKPDRDVDIRERIMCIKKGCAGHANVPLSKIWAGKKHHSEQYRMQLSCRTSHYEWFIVNVQKVVKLLDRLEARDEEDSKPREDGLRSGPSYIPLPVSLHSLENNLDPRDPEHRAILKKHHNPLPTFLLTGDPMRAYTAARNLSDIAYEAHLMVYGAGGTAAEANTIIGAGFDAAREVLKECEIGFGKDSAVYPIEIVQVKKFCVIAMLLKETIKAGFWGHGAYR
ncbi:hypothetical protein OIV83_006212 [Microbotryomycetes sp. JL201]|nr:hypothetical protein OIV83_006212 [Microbotryomycetes sp. JL201]